MSEAEVRKTLKRSCSELYESNHGQNFVSINDSVTTYTEIAFQPDCIIKYDNNSSEDGCAGTPDGLWYNKYQNTCEDVKLDSNEQYELQKVSEKTHLKRPVSLLCDKSFPYDLEGTVRREGEITHFVAENLEYKIKLSSPITKRDINPPNVSSKNSTPSTSVGLLSKHFLQSQLAQIDSNVLSDIEIDAQYLAASVDNLTENLYNLLHSISSITADNVEIHKNSVNKLTDNMDANIKCMYTIMAKTEEISKSMKPTEQLAMRIREIKRLVDMLENNL